jgi:hypothetical protein
VNSISRIEVPELYPMEARLVESTAILVMAGRAWQSRQGGSIVQVAVVVLIDAADRSHMLKARHVRT